MPLALWVINSLNSLCACKCDQTCGLVWSLRLILEMACSYGISWMNMTVQLYRPTKDKEHKKYKLYT